MSLKKIEAKLDKLAVAGGLACAEGLELMQTWYEYMSGEEFGFYDELILPSSSNLDILEAGGGLFIKQKGAENVETVYVFLHHGIDLDLELMRYFKQDNWFQLVDTIYQNADRGTRWMATELLAELESGDELHVEGGFAVALYNISRVMADGNRITREEQVVLNPYKGESVWKDELLQGNSEGGLEQVREEVGAKLVDPFVQLLRDQVRELKPKFLFYPHTYDRYGGGNASGGHERNDGVLERPPSMMIVNHFREEKAHGIYGPEDASLEVDFISKKQIEFIQEMQKELLGGIRDLAGKQLEIPVDYPYHNPLQLPMALWQDFKGPQLVLEYRKDLFRNGQAQILESMQRIGATIPKL